MNLGENTLLVPKFWVNFHFGPKIDFVNNIISKKKKIDSILVTAINPLTETSYVADGTLADLTLTWC